VPSTRVWGNPETANVRPGVDIVGGGQCTANFLFHLDNTRYFLGAAAHCFQDDSDPTYQSCPSPGVQAPGTSVDVYGRDSENYVGTLAYSSFFTMNRDGESDPNICAANDFALVELPPDVVSTTHPSVLGFSGPTALASPDSYLVRGDRLHAYANSDLRPTWLIHGEGFASDASFTRYTADGWGIHAGVATPPLVQGDSGGPVLDASGHAVGALSVISARVGADPVETRWTNIARALWYMYVHEGWAPTLVEGGPFEA